MGIASVGEINPVETDAAVKPEMARDLPSGLDAIWRNIETAQPFPAWVKAQREQVVAIPGAEFEQRRRFTRVPAYQLRQRADPVSIVVPGGYSDDPAIHFRKAR